MTTWRKSSHSTANGSDVACVEVAFTKSSIAIRDSKNPDGARLSVGEGSWHAFLRSVR